MDLKNMTEKDWKNYTKGLLKSEMVKRNISHDELIKKLEEINIEETSGSIANKLSRGTFSAVFFLQCLRAIGCNALQIQD